MRRIVGAKELPGLRITSLSLHLAHYPEALVQSHVPPLVGPFSSGTLAGPEVTASFKKSGTYISPLSCQDRKEFCLSQNRLRLYGRWGLAKLQDGEAIREAKMDPNSLRRHETKMPCAFGGPPPSLDHHGRLQLCERSVGK